MRHSHHRPGERVLLLGASGAGSCDDGRSQAYLAAMRKRARGSPLHLVASLRARREAAWDWCFRTGTREIRLANDTRR